MISLPITHYPDHGIHNIGGNEGYTINSTNTRYGFVFEVPKSGIVNSVSFVVNLITTAANLSVGLYTLNSNGLPGANYGGSTDAVISSYSVGAVTVNLGSPATVVKGDKIALIIGWESSYGNLRIGHRNNSYIATAFPYRVFYAVGTSTWSKYIATGGEPIIWLTYSDGSLKLPFRCSPETYFGYDSLSADTQGEVGISFIPPTNLRATGFMIADNSPTYANEHRLYKEKSLIESMARPTLSIAAAGYVYHEFPAPIILTAGSRYHLVIASVPQTAFYYVVTMHNKDLKDQYYNDPSLCKCSRTYGGSWDYYHTKIPLFSVLIDGIDIPINRRTSTGR